MGMRLGLWLIFIFSDNTTRCIQYYSTSQ